MHLCEKRKFLTPSQADHLEHVRNDIRTFKSKNGLDKVIVLWTANTERFSEIIPGVNDTQENLMSAIKSSHSEISPSTIFAVASILEGCPYINGSPQNTFVPGKITCLLSSRSPFFFLQKKTFVEFFHFTGVIELAESKDVMIGGDDFKSGQTKMKSVMVDFLVSAGIK